MGVFSKEELQTQENRETLSERESEKSERILQQGQEIKGKRKTKGLTHRNGCGAPVPCNMPHYLGKQSVSSYTAPKDREIGVKIFRGLNTIT